MRLLEKLASEEGFYKSEMQLVVSQLQKDLFVDIDTMPEHIQKRLEAAHVETFLSHRVPHHVYSSELLSSLRQSQTEADRLTQESTVQLAHFRVSSQRLTEERDSLSVQLQAYLQQPHLHAEVADQLRSEVLPTVD